MRHADHRRISLRRRTFQAGWPMVRKLQQEIKQSRPFATLEEEAMLNLARTADRLQSCFRQMLKPHGLTPAQYNALRILRGAGPDGMTCSELGGRMISADPDITRLLDRMKKQNLVRRHRDQDDRRVSYTGITPAGLQKLKRLDPLVLENVQGQLKHMSQERLSFLIDLLEEARQSADCLPDNAPQIQHGPHD